MGELPSSPIFIRREALMTYGREPSTRFDKIMYWTAWIVGIIGMAALIWFFFHGTKP